MAHLFIYNYQHSSWYTPANDNFDLEALAELCPDAKWQRQEDLNRLKNFCEVAHMETLYNPFTVYFEDDGEALAFMMIQDTFVKRYKDDLKLMMILENPDWADVMAGADEVRAIEEKTSRMVAGGSNAYVNSSKRKYDKFKDDMLSALRSFSDDFKTRFYDFEKEYMAEIEAYRSAQKDKGRELTNAKNRMRNRLNKYVVKKVKRK